MKNLKDKLEDIYDWYYNKYRYVTVIFWEKLFRAIDHFKFGWKTPDWDNCHLHETVLYKLKRMQYLFIHYGNHAEECQNYKPKMKSIRICIKLLELSLNCNWWRSEMEKWSSHKLYSYMDMVERKENKRITLAYKIINKYNNYWWD